MGKIYKGWELIKAIADGEIKNNTKIIPHYPNDNCIVEYFEYSYGFFKAYYKEGRKSDKDVNVCVFLDNDRTFEVTENEMDIDNIEEYKQEHTERCIDIDIRNKINELVQVVKQLDKRIKKLEE